MSAGSIMNDMTDTIIDIPIDWNQVKDAKYFQEFFAEQSELVAHLQWSLSEKHRVLGSALKHLNGEIPPLLASLSERSKLRVLRQLTNNSQITDSVRARILGDLDLWERVIMITEPVFERYTIEPKKVWLREIVDAYDWTVVAWTSLEETFGCEFSDCELSKVPPEPRAKPQDVPTIATKQAAHPIQNKRSMEAERGLLSRDEPWCRTYMAQANVNLYATAEFTVRATGTSQAEQAAKILLAGITVHLCGQLGDGRIIILDLHPDNVETQVVAVEEKTCVAPENPALDRLAEAEMGALIFREMRDLANENDSDRADRAVVETELPGAVKRLFERLWRLYLLAKGRG